MSKQNSNLTDGGKTGFSLRQRYPLPKLDGPVLRLTHHGVREELVF